MDWVHCNACYRQPDDPDCTPVHMTDCSHLFCNLCWQKHTHAPGNGGSPVFVCPECRKHAATYPLTSQTGGRPRRLCQSITTTASECFRTLMEAIEFQKTHSHHLFKQNKDKINLLKGRINVMMAEYQKLRAEKQATDKKLLASEQRLVEASGEKQETEHKLHVTQKRLMEVEEELQKLRRENASFLQRLSAIASTQAQVHPQATYTSTYSCPQSRDSTPALQMTSYQKPSSVEMQSLRHSHAPVISHGPYGGSGRHTNDGTVHRPSPLDAIRQKSFSPSTPGVGSSLHSISPNRGSAHLPISDISLLSQLQENVVQTDLNENCAVGSYTWTVTMAVFETSMHQPELSMVYRCIEVVGRDAG
ncbi:unnamed protein product [Darwinula stevensoni]|uniref:RING-type domain-containing protein n=1 Tax=Darwinula stevensoni TaxID=69355 RepID=A0A7R8XI78_9CRUS|nr:unnamed protein product [Darwinula stevensoni]CAG0891060.1 unnamed protein product [Darwinula stevensoni]